MEFLNNSEAKKMKDKNLHLFIFEEIPVLAGTPGAGKGKDQILYTYRPLLDCTDLASYDEKEKTHKFPGVSLLSSLLEQTSGRPLFEKTLMVEIHETFFEVPKKQSKGEPVRPIQREKFLFRGKFSVLDALKYALDDGVFMLYLQDAKKRVKGKFYL